MATTLDPRTVAFTATVEFQNRKTGKGFEWVGIESSDTDVIGALADARAKAINIAAVDGDAKLVAKLSTAVAAMIRIGQEWDATGKLIRFDGQPV